MFNISILSAGISYSTISIIIVLVLFAVIGGFRGLFKSLFGLLSVGLSIVAAIFISPSLYPAFAKIPALSDGVGIKISQFLSIIVVTIVAFIVLKIIFFFVNRMLSGLPIIGWLNRVLGAIYGFAIGFFLLSLLFYIATIFNGVSFFTKILEDAAKDPFSTFFTQNNVIAKILEALAKSNETIRKFVEGISAIQSAVG